MIREGYQVKFRCGHTMAYDKNSGQGSPIVGTYGLCRQCADDEHFTGRERIVEEIRICWIETQTIVHFTDPAEPAEPSE